jgi:transposase
LRLKAHTVIRVEEKNECMLVWIDRLGRRLLRCGVCRQRCLEVHDIRKEREWRDLSMRNLALKLRYRPRRVECPRCGRHSRNSRRCCGAISKKGLAGVVPPCSNVPSASVRLTSFKDRCASRPAMLRAEYGLKYGLNRLAPLHLVQVLILTPNSWKVEYAKSPLVCRASEAR